MWAVEVCISTISANYTNVSFSSGLSGGVDRLTSIRSLQRAAFQQRGEYQKADAGLEELSRKLEQLSRASERYRLVSGQTSTQAAEAVGLSLGLTTIDSISTLTGSEEINTSTTSFTPRGPGWDGGRGSTAEITVGGTYAGATDDTLSFEVFRDRAVGGSLRLKLDIYDSTGAYLERVTWDSSAPAGTVETTSFGLELSFGAGDLKIYDTFHVDVSASAGTDAVASSPLGGLRNDHPELEDAHAVTDGQFLLNGETISVSASDSITDVLDRITASAAGVTASLAGDVVTLTADDAGEDISLTSDTSGLIAALKLDTGVLTPGTMDERTAPMSEVAALSGVTGGSLQINGESISVSASDSITDVLDRISASAAGVTASLTAGGAVRIVSDSGDPVVISADTSGFLATVGIDPDTYSGAEEMTARRGSRLAARKLSEAIAALAEPLNALLASTGDDDLIRLDRISMQSRLKAAIRGAFEESDLDPERNDVGLEFSLDSDDGTPSLDLSISDLRSLQDAMRQGPREMTRFLFGSQRREGLLARLTDAVEVAREEIRQQAGGIAVGLSAYI